LSRTNVYYQWKICSWYHISTS